MSNQCRNPGRRATVRLASRKMRRRHRILVIRATGPEAPKVLMVLTPEPAALSRSKGSPERAGRALGHWAWERHLLVTVIGCAWSYLPSRGAAVTWFR
jgi:hypothetical protein